MNIKSGLARVRILRSDIFLIDGVGLNYPVKGRLNKVWISLTSPATKDSKVGMKRIPHCNSIVGSLGLGLAVGIPSIVGGCVDAIKRTGRSPRY